jgi:hypothetical protein
MADGRKNQSAEVGTGAYEKEMSFDKKVEYIDGYGLRLHFDDRSIKVVDLENMLKRAKNMLLPLKDLEYFKKVLCDGFSICWPNGVDFCPDVLYSMGRKMARPSRRKRPSSRPKSRRRRKSKLYV